LPVGNADAAFDRKGALKADRRKVCGPGHPTGLVSKFCGMQGPAATVARKKARPPGREHEGTVKTIWARGNCRGWIYGCDMTKTQCAFHHYLCHTAAIRAASGAGCNSLRPLIEEGGRFKI